MSSIPQNYSDEKALVDCVQRFLSKQLLFTGNVINLAVTRDIKQC